LTDDELMALVARGDGSACRALVHRWERPVFAFLARMVGERARAQELAQETFLRMFREAPRYQAAGQFRGWLFRIAGNLARSELRRRRVVRWLRFDPRVHDRPSAADPPGRELERGEQRSAVRAALDRLPERQREAVVLRHYQDLSYREIARAMKISERAVDALLQRAMAALRKGLERREVAE
jgi:RNA polymerase sigma-70 factor (ECF subfamily)